MKDLSTRFIYKKGRQNRLIGNSSSKPAPHTHSLSVRISKKKVSIGKSNLLSWSNATLPQHKAAANKKSTQKNAIRFHRYHAACHCWAASKCKTPRHRVICESFDPQIEKLFHVHSGEAHIWGECQITQIEFLTLLCCESILMLFTLSLALPKGCESRIVDILLIEIEI